jgi:hypothetical protein
MMPLLVKPHCITAIGMYHYLACLQLVGGVPGVPPNPADGVAGVPASEGLGQVNQSQLHLTQLLGSAGQEEVLMEQPRAHIIAKARLPRNGRVVSRGISLPVILGPC